MAKMARAEQLDVWMPRLIAATEHMRVKRQEAIDAEHELRDCIRDAFADGLTVNPIMEATGYSQGRCYQINRGVRH